MRVELTRRLAALEKQDYFEMLGVGREATLGQIQSAYHAFVKTWHPDRLPAALKADGSTFVSRLGEAFATLSEEARRLAYLERLEQSGGHAADEEQKVARVLRAALEFKKAEVLLKNGNAAGAEAHLAQALEDDPEQPEYVTMSIWLTALKRGDPPPMKEGTTSKHFDDLIARLTEVLAQNPKFERAVHYRGTLLKRTGHHDKALRDFRVALELNPRNLDAAREIRLHERRGAAPASTGSGEQGLLKNLFKKP
jgi:curved DNA-binding protein CbpA